MKMPRSFSEVEKEDIRKRLIIECEKSWSASGYKKTSISELCAQVGISAGAFYLLYDSKESLFCDVMDNLQERSASLVRELLSAKPSKEEICHLLKQLYLEYDRTNILTQRNSADYKNFLNRVPKEWIEKHIENNDKYLESTFFNPNVKLKMSKEKAFGILHGIMMIVLNKDILGYDHYEIFCTLLNCVIDEVYEW